MAETLGELNIDIAIDWRKVEKAFSKVSASATKASTKIKSKTSNAFKSISRNAFKAVAKAAIALKGLGGVALNVTGNVVGVFTNAFKKIVKIIRTSMLVASASIAGLFAVSVKNATKQEDALFALATALSLTGDASQDALEDYQRFASGLQKTTVIGDEQTLALLAQHKQLGVVTEDLKKAAKFTIGIAAATGRSTEAISLYVASALQGETAMLARYIPALKGVSDETEAMAIITDFATKGMKVAEGRTKTTSGAFQQMKNAIGDVTEIIGQPFLASIVRSSKALQSFAEKNQKRIGEWAQKVSDAFDRVKARVLTKENFSKMVSGFRSLIAIVTPFVNKIKEGIKAIVAFGKEEENIDKIKNALNAVVEIVKDLFKRGEKTKIFREGFVLIGNTIKNTLPLLEAFGKVALSVGKIFKVLNFIFFGIINLFDKAITKISNFGRSILGISEKDLPAFIQIFNKASMKVNSFIIDALKIGAVILQFKVVKGLFTDTGKTIKLLATIIKLLATSITTAISKVWGIISGIFFSMVTALGLVTSASATVVTALSAVAAAVGWLGGKFQLFIYKGLLKSLGVFDAVNNALDTMAGWFAKIISYIPGLRRLFGITERIGDGTGGMSEENLEKVKIQKQRHKQLQQGFNVPSTSTTNVPVASPRAITAANARNAMTAGERENNELLKQLIEVTKNQPKLANKLANTY